MKYYVLLLTCFVYTSCSTFSLACDENDTSQMCIEKSGFNGVLAIEKNGVWQLSDAFGYSDIVTKKTLSVDQRFRIGSISKTFTAGAIQLLVQSKMMAYDDKLSKYVDKFPNGDNITVRMLVNHTSGIADYSQKDFEKYLFEAVTVEQMINLIKSKNPQDEPGKNFKYNNAEYTILSYLIEKASGMLYEDYLEKNIFKPLGLSNTGYKDYDSEITNLSTGHLSKLKVDPKKYNHSMIKASGGLFSNLEDLKIWVNAHQQGTFFSEEYKNSLIGMAQGERYGKYSYWHTGITNNFCGMLFFTKEKGNTMIFISNEGAGPVAFAKAFGSYFFEN